MFPGSVFVPPSGDTAGATDHANIAAATALVSYAATDNRLGIIRISGDYTINDVLAFGAPDKKFVILDGMGYSRIAYRGAKTERYALTFAGSGRQRATLCKDIRLDGFSNCRGIKFDTITYQNLVDNVYVYGTRQLAVNAHFCWGSSLRGLTMDSFTGVGLFADQFNGCLAESVCVNYGFGCWYAGESPTSAKSKELQAYEVANGKAAAEKQYGTNYAQDWPDDIVAAENRALICIYDGSVQNWQNLVVENSHPCEYPTMYNYGSHVRLSGMYNEANSQRNTVFVLLGVAHNPNWFTTLTEVRDCRPVGGTGCRRSLVELRGTTFGARVTNSVAHKLGKSVIYAADGTHYGASVDRFCGADPVLSAYDWVQAHQKATLVDPIPEDALA